MNTTKHHDLKAGLITLTTYDGQGRRISEFMTDENNHPIQATRYDGQNQATIAFPPPEYRLEILNWKEPRRLITRPQLSALIRTFPERNIDWPKIAGAMGHRVRASWHWPNDLQFGYDCDMEVRGDEMTERDRYVRTINHGWQRR